MSNLESQSYIRQQATELADLKSSSIFNQIFTPAGHHFKIYDLQWYHLELNKFEQFYLGDLMLGSIKITREYIPVKNRLGDPQFSSFENHCYYTKIVDTSLDSK